MADDFYERQEEHHEDDLPEFLRLSKPCAPMPDECCGNGCNTCVNDIYEQELKIWKNECDDYKKQQLIASDPNANEPPIFSERYVKFPLKHILSYTNDSKIYRFTFCAFKSLNFKIGQHLVMRGKVDGASCAREYTPVSSSDAKGYFDVLIKLYKDGKMSQYIAAWHVGIEVEWRGPQGTFEYQPNSFKKIYMLAAGTGITPMIQIIRTILENENEETYLHLMFACQTYDGILMKSQLTEFKHYWNFKIEYYISQDSSRGSHYGEEIYHKHIDGEVLSKHLSPDKALVLICGTRSFNSDMEKYAKELGFSTEQYYIF